jgi:DNA-binding transcriptional regulator YiaG
MKQHHMTGVGLSNVYLRNGFTVEDSDGDETISYENLTGLYFEISRAIASTPFTMRAEEFRFMRKQLQMSQADIAVLFDKSDQAIA